jgi:nitrate reductase gamma subunit
MSRGGFDWIDLYDLAMGPLLVVACGIFVLGFAWRLYRYARLTGAVPARNRAGRTVGLATSALPGARQPALQVAGHEADDALLLAGKGPAGRAWYRLRRLLRKSPFAESPVMALVSPLFHFLLLIVPLFLPAHNILLFRSFCIGLPGPPEALMDRLTVLIIIIGCSFMLRRVLVRRVRALTTVGDVLVLALVAAPFLSAWLAYNQVLGYREVLVSHMLLGELLIATIPFTKLGHMPFLLFSRLFRAGEQAWGLGGHGPARRRWAR